MPCLINNQFKLKHKLGEGSFGDVYSGYDIHTRRKVAIKIAKDNKEHSIQKEGDIYRYLQSKCKGGELDFHGIPNFYWSGRENGYHYLVIDRHSESFDKLFEENRLTTSDIYQLALEGLYILEYLHSNGLIHQDMKPDNFIQRRGHGSNHKQVLLIDFGLAKKYVDDHGNHLPISYNHKLVGTARYVSSNIHRGYSQSRRDDLESFGYMLIYLIKGKLPWNGIRDSNKLKKYRKIGEIKIETSTKKLCHDLPPIFEKYLNYCKNLSFTETPDYNYLRNLFIKE